ncbi:hypothetical protein HPB51_008521 [Rhipicephalus microplus]|uniref:Uncharacterized protein n=1 Tax=Rhipicephalus microplus TaxID=6941 RepID=A0A9J6ERT3_RHIMP|nr:hypothetical protein HPB51_008521 [Rhipicephalus microplus]
MDRHAGQKRRTKYRTKYGYGKCERKPPVWKTKRSAAIDSDKLRTASLPSHVSSETDTCSMPLLGSEAYYAEPLTSHDIAAGFERDRRLVSMAADDNIVPAHRNDDKSVVGSEAYDPGPSSSRGIAVQCEREKSFFLAAANDNVVPRQLSRMSAIVFLSGSALLEYIWNLVSCPWKPAVSPKRFARCRQWSQVRVPAAD